MNWRARDLRGYQRARVTGLPKPINIDRFITKLYNFLGLPVLGVFVKIGNSGFIKELSSGIICLGGTPLMTNPAQPDRSVPKRLPHRPRKTASVEETEVVDHSRVLARTSGLRRRKGGVANVYGRISQEDLPKERGDH